MVLRVESSKLVDVLPPIYHWWDKVKIETSTSLMSEAMHVIACRTSKDDFELEAPALDANLLKNVKNLAKKMGWQGKSGCQVVIADGHFFALLVCSTIPTTAAQISRQFGIDLATELVGREPKKVVLVAGKDDLSLMNVLEGLSDGFYKRKTFRSDYKEAHTQKLPEFIYTLGKTLSVAELNETRHRSQAIAFARMLQDAPSNWLNSIRFSEVAKEISAQFGFKVSISGKKELEALGMGAFLSVGQGSPFEPQMIVIEIEGQDKTRTTALIGKGLTFDAGGVSIKPSIGMDEMKYDMSGGAAVLGAARFFGGVKPKTNVICVIGAVENVISGHATKPGDICTAYNGKTIEILNTDAEGRLVLCDLLAYVTKKYSPELTVDIATLTGAVLFGLGTVGAALLSNDQPSAAKVLALSEKVGEPFWQLPLWPELEKEIKAEAADYKNIANPSVKAGTIIGAVFLKQFIHEKCKWVHLDIAGTAANCAATGYPRKGGAAFGLRLLAEICLDRL